MARVAFIEIDGARYRWRDILEPRKQQLRERRRAEQPALFDLNEDNRPPSQRTAARRYSEPDAVR